MEVPPAPVWSRAVVDGYLSRLADQRGLSAHTLDAYRRDLCQFFDYCDRGGVGSVAGVWREVLGEAVTGAMRQGLLVDLRSSTYAAFWRPAKDLAHRVATVRVLHESDGRRTVVSHFNKATKGRIVRALLEDGADPRTPAALADALTRLGWTVEPGEPTSKGTKLDVVVSEV